MKRRHLEFDIRHGYLVVLNRSVARILEGAALGYA